LVAAVVINPPRSRAFPKPDFGAWLRMRAWL
jgi:spore germination cell wall hydrolase CwlJ-like protein